jgi:hypothetical protein
MRGVRTAGLCSQRTKRLGHQGAKTREEHPERELTNVGARCDTSAVDLRCASRLWRNRDLQKSLFLAHNPADFSSSSYSEQDKTGSGYTSQTANGNENYCRAMVTWSLFHSTETRARFAAR